MFVSSYLGVDSKYLKARMNVPPCQHYRIVDVSSVRELAKRWAPPEALRGRPEKRAEHRALDDIRESIAELRYYKENVFK